MELTVCWSSRKGKRSSRRCHSCLYRAVVSSTSYLLRILTVIITTQHICLSVGPPPPRPLFLFLLCPPTLTDDPNSPALTRSTMQACYSRMLRIGCMLPLVKLLRNVKGELTVARCIQQLSTDGRIEFLKDSEPGRTWNWIMTFERFEKWNEKHQGVIVKTNKQFLEQQKQMF